MFPPKPRKKAEDAIANVIEDAFKKGAHHKLDWMSDTTKLKGIELRSWTNLL